jgi:hypothetical protein
MNRMRTLALAMLVAAAIQPFATTHAQARGPSAKEVLETGQQVRSSVPDWSAHLGDLARQTGIDLAELQSGRLSWSPEVGFVLERDGEKIPLGKLGPPAPPALDEAARASKNQEHRALLARLVGRFRLGGRVEKSGIITVEIVGQRNERIDTTLGGDVSGVADCAAVGKGPGVHCIISAIWPVIEPIEPCTTPGCGMGGPLPASELTMVFRPAVMVLGLDPDTAEIRASMVTDDSIAHTWTGRLEANTLTARRITSCVSVQQNGLIGLSGPPTPCFQPLQIVAEPDSDAITMVHSAAGVTIRVSMQRDPAARAEKPMKTKKVR